MKKRIIKEGRLSTPAKAFTVFPDAVILQDMESVNEHLKGGGNRWTLRSMTRRN